MNTLQHSLITLLESQNTEDFKKIIPYVLMPDAIRCYTKERKWSHFEMDPETGEPNVFKYPENIKDWDKIDMKIHVLNDVQFKPAVIGEETSIAAFERSNQHLSTLMFNGIYEHLRQDVSFDKWIREEYDCSGKYEDKFIVQGEEVDGKEFRKVIGQMEMEAVACLTLICHEKLGITITNDWFRENVFDSMEKVYPESMTTNTCKYMIIPEEMEQKIVNGEWEQLLEENKYLTMENYMNYHDMVIQQINNIEIEKEIVGNDEVQKVNDDAIEFVNE